MKIKLHSRALQENLYGLIIDPESLYKISMSEENGDFKLVYKKNSRETISYLERSREDLESDFNSLTSLLEKLND